jgi:hypothetical protein
MDRLKKTFGPRFGGVKRLQHYRFAFVANGHSRSQNVDPFRQPHHLAIAFSSDCSCFHNLVSWSRFCLLIYHGSDLGVKWRKNVTYVPWKSHLKIASNLFGAAPRLLGSVATV